MIVNVRVDHRLLHGQVAMAWNQVLGSDCILIANDSVPNDEIRKAGIKLAKPANTKLVIKNMDASVEALVSGVTDKYKLFIVVESIADVYKLCKETGMIDKITLGGVKSREGTRQISKAVFTMILKAILLGLVAMLGHTNFLFGTNLLDRPLIMCTLTGLVMGDLKSGIIIGAMMELAFIGAFSVGASLPPDMISGGVLGAALTLAAGNDPEVALTIGVPIASLALLMKNACKIFILPIFVHKADDYAVKGNSKGVARMHMLGGFLYLNLPYGIFVFLAFLLGNTVIQSVLDAIPQFVKSGLTIATGLMPALGFAVLASMIINKKNWYFLLLGFLISAYMGMSVTGVALFATVIALIIVNMQNNQVITATEMGGDEDDDF